MAGALCAPYVEQQVVYTGKGQDLEAVSVSNWSAAFRASAMSGISTSWQ